MKKISILIFFLQCFCFASFASISQADSTGIAQVDNKTYVEYNVSPGETIYGISTKYKVNVEDLLEINPQLTNGLKVGQIILIPIENWNLARVAAAKKSNTTKVETPVTEIKPNTEIVVKTDREEGGKTYHTVQPGETMYSLSKKYGVSVSDLVMMNVPDLKVGQEIIVKSDKVKIKDVAQQVAKPKEENTNKVIIKDNKPSSEAPQEEGPSDDTTNVVYSNNVPNVLVIPFDPHLYWSDADMEISKQSKMEMHKVRQAFRKRLNTLLEPKGYNTIHLMGGQVRDSLTDLNRIYSSVSYDYKDVIYTEANPKPVEPKPKTDLKTDVKNGINNAVNGVTNIFNKDKEKDKTTVQQQPTQGNTSRAVHAKNPAKYYAVTVRDPNFFTYFNNKYHTDYYIFVNQFEVETDYEHCLDRARQNYERNFVTHFSIYDKSGKQVAGHRIITHYNSNSNNMGQILKDNMEIIAARILAELPKR